MKQLPTFRALLWLMLLGFGGVWMTAACGSNGSDGDPPDPRIKCPGRTPERGWLPGTCVPNNSRPGLPGGVPSNSQPECPATNETPCMRYLIPLVGSQDLALRANYIKAFGSACYMSEANTFDCFYKKEQMTPKGKACTDAQMIGEVSGNAPYDTGYLCQSVGNGDYTLQIGPDVANKLFIYLMDAPRQTPFIDVNGTPTEVSGPYRNLVEVTTIEPGKDFEDNSGMFNDKGEALTQQKWVLEVNRKAHGGKIHSDLAGYMFPCEKGKPEMCPEPDVLGEPSWLLDARAEVHHVVPKKDPRCCPWGTNSYKNAAVISHKLNVHFTNNDPPVDEVLLVNKIPPYTP